MLKCIFNSISKFIPYANVSGPFHCRNFYQLEWQVSENQRIFHEVFDTLLARNECFCCNDITNGKLFYCVENRETFL